MNSRRSPLAGALLSLACCLNSVAAEERPEPDRPTVVGIYPATAQWPQNTLRFYVEFSHAMNRGDADRAVRLIDPEGRRSPGAFLSIGQELWSRDAKRLTVLFDPGRIKQGVAPNRQVGPPLELGGRHRLVIGGLTDHRDRRVEPTEFAFVVTPAVVEKVDPAGWSITPADPAGDEAIEINTGRPLDRYLFARMARVVVRDEAVAGRFEFEGTTVRFKPHARWPDGRPRVEAPPGLEDYCGNRVDSAFDQIRGPSTGED